MRRILIAFGLLTVFLTLTCSNPAKAESPYRTVSGNYHTGEQLTPTPVPPRDPGTGVMDTSTPLPPAGPGTGVMDTSTPFPPAGPETGAQATPTPIPSPSHPPTESTAPITSKTGAAVPVSPTPESDIVTITLSFAGDCTIGDDDKYTWNNFDRVYREVGDPAYFFAGVQEVFAHDDLTFVNLEGTFTTASKKAEKKYRFKGDPSYIEVLKQGSVEAVTLANNHSLDYLEKGFSDTVKTLTAANIPYTYFETAIIREVKGLKIGYLGYKGWEHEKRSNRLLEEQVRNLRQQGVSFIVANYHWGDELSYVPNSLQKRMARFAIDQGVDLVIGHHPHVMQGMEIYKGRNILYSLGNFCFGGAPNPRDKDTFIYQHILHYDTIHKCILRSDCSVIPARVSSEDGRNTYQPILAEGREKDRILQKFLDLSGKIR